MAIDGLDGFTDNDTGYVGFALQTSQGDIIESFSMASTGQINGIGLIEVSTAPVTMTLNNVSTHDIRYAKVPVKANLMVHNVSFTTELKQIRIFISKTAD